MYKYCPEVEGYYIQGAPSMMKRNISPPLGYANGSQGKMIGIVPREGNVLPAGAPGEMIMIEPPEYIIMEVTHTKGDEHWTTIVPCKRQKVTYDYKRDKEDKKFSCFSNSVNLRFAFTIHETQGQTLEKAILILGRMQGLNVGQITWSLLYVALSRTKELKDLKFLPSSWSGFTNFKHLTRLKPSSIFVKWNSGYRNNVWCPEILEKQNLQNEMNVRNKLVRQGPRLSLSKTNDILQGYLIGLGYRVLTKTKRDGLQKMIMVYMENKKLWNLGEDKTKYFSKRGTRKRKNSQVKKNLQRKKSKLSDDKKSECLNLDQQSDSVKEKQKVPKKKLPDNKKKSKKKEEEEKLPERYVLPDELIFGKLIFERKGYRINPMERDGNCLFRAVAEQVYCDPKLYNTLKNECLDFMEEEEKWFSEFFADNVDYKEYISNLREDGAWGGNPEIVALSNLFKRPFEIYENSLEPKKVDFSNDQGNNLPPIRLLYRNNHYAAIRSDDKGDMFDFEGLEPGELEQQMVNLNDLATIRKSKEFQKRIQSEKKNLCNLDPDVRKVTEESILFEEMQNAAKRYYLSKLKNKTNQQN